MYNLDIIRTFKIKAKFTAEDWRLFIDSYDCSYATKELNAGLTLSVNTHSDRREVEREMDGLMRIHADKGATEEEPHEFLMGVLDFIYGTNSEEHF